MGLPPLVGREEEAQFLTERWAQVKQGASQVVLLSGEAGIGKSRLVRVLREHLAGEPYIRLECRCSAYHRNSALYPVIDLLQRVFQFDRDDSPRDKLGKLEATLKQYRVTAPETMGLFASLLSLPAPEQHPPLALSP